MHDFLIVLNKLISASKVGYKTCFLSYSRPASLVLSQLYYEGFINGFSVFKVSNKKYFKVYLKYNFLGNPPFQKIKIFFSRTTPVYVGFRELSKLYKTLEILFVSTPKGIFSHKECLKRKLGGVLICSVL